MIIGISMQQASGAEPHVQSGQQTEGAAEEEEVDNYAPEGSQVPSQNYQPPTMNGGMPPQQVYVNANGMGHPGMAGLETQFQSLGFGQEDGVYDPNGHSQQNGDSATGDDNDGEDTEDDPVKLFVGQVPKSLNEEDIFPTFDSFGPLKDVAIIRDKNTGLHRGCAFVTFWSGADAERAQDALHDKFTFPGGRRPAQVKPAEPTVLPENKLFIGMLSRKAGEPEVRELFEPFGEIREIYMIRNADGSSKCAAFLRYVKRDSALKAIESLNNTIMMEGAARPLIVKFADNKHQRQQRHIRNVRKQEMMAAMGAAYPGFPQVPPPMGMPGQPGAMPQYPLPPPQFGAGGYAHGPAGAHHPPPHPYMYPPHHYGPAPPYAFQGRQEMRPPNPRPREGPAGANLFVYHLPHDLTDADLATAFNPFGNVISAKVYVDKYTGESKGFGFVSYDSVLSAESAIEQMNGFQIGNKRLKVQHKRVHGSNPNLPPSSHQAQAPHPGNAPSTPGD